MQTPKKIAAMRARKRIECWVWISEFPCFRGIDKDGIRPLKIGIDKDFCALPPELRPVSKAQIRRTLHDYCQTPEYLEAVGQGKRRVDMLGRPV